MLERWKQEIERLSPAAKAALREGLRLREGAVYAALMAQHAMQADVVLVLLRAGTADCRRAAERLVGHRIRRGLPSVPPEPRPVRPSPRQGDDRRFTYVAKANPRYPETGAHARWRHFRVGRSVEQYLAAGGSRRDLRDCVRAGWVRVEEDKR